MAVTEEQTAISIEVDADGIATLTIDMPGRSMNVINDELGAGLESSLKRVQEDDVTGVIITSGKPAFVAGADIDGLIQLTDAKQAFEMCEALKAGLRAFETLGKPVVAVVNGTALGGGLEICLACHRRIVVNNPKAKFGFPEVKLGLLPGGGGVTRLPRMLGLQDSFSYLMEGKEVGPEKAVSVGIMDELAESVEDGIAKAKAWIKENPKAKAPWDIDGFKIPGGDPRRPQIAQMLAIAPAMLRKKTHGNYPAPEAIMAAAVEGAVVPFDTASRIESRYFAKLATGNVAKNMINAFWFQLNKIKAGESRPNVEPTVTEKVGVLGAGMMGHGIAHASAMAGMDVVMKDVDMDAANAGMEKIGKLLDKAVSRGKMTKEKRDEIYGRITPTDKAEDLKGCDLIIEAVFENRELKAKVTAEAEAQIDDTAIFGSNTSTLPITGLAEASKRPEQFVGIHFFSPVDKMPLVEIIVGEKTNDHALAKAFDYVLKIKKTPIVVNDSRGFYTSRVFGTYVSEGAALLAEGQNARAIESAGLKAGMPVGPLALMDEVNLGLAMHIREQTEKDLAAEGKSLPPHPGDGVVQKMVNDAGRQGKAQGKGFYEYPENGTKFLWPGLTEMFPESPDQLDQQEMIDRMMFAQVVDTARCFEEGVFTNVADGNIGSIFGWGFAPFKGGTLQFINDYGVAEFVARAKELAAKYGDRFNPPALLEEMAASGKTFE